MPDKRGKHGQNKRKLHKSKDSKPPIEDSSTPKDKSKLKLSAKDWLKGAGTGVGAKSQFGVEIARWDDDSELAKKADAVLKEEAKNPFKKKRRLDQWDEEYDMGRLKKVRKGKEEDDGPRTTENPFQKWANNK